ncbi:hypothetical protein POL68_21510 [Stigmatella sp. ncwal1]|uniref:HEXXH motif-containing protein n=1 Tax=Stigmatella ashevillensis TaxID=2995309 RepID=A0ABT5DE48_9BACT|nr:hypothetical protein [Stigmatella ashevillena]MDC0711063.1 hypothetical protein [Stigmatella ashevillena]
MSSAPTPAGPVLELSSVFDWKPTRLPALINQRFLARVANDLNASVKENGALFGRAQEAARLLQEVKELPDAALLRILSSPEVYFLLTEARSEQTQGLLPALESWLHAERARADADYPLSEATWSALGDVYFPAGPRSSPVAASLKPGTWTPEAPYEAWRGHGTIPVDFFSPYARRPIPSASYRPVQIGPVAELSPAERGDVVGRLTGALDALSQLGPALHGFVLQMARVIMPRRDDVNAHLYTSVSSRAFIGRVTLVNPQLSHIDVTALTGSLIHESIHAFLYMCELEAPIVQDWERVRGTLLVSPWTGGRLTLHTYLHASFVWYGLSRLWHLPKAEQVFPAEALAEHRARAAEGFARGILGPLEPVRHHVSPYVMEQLQWMDAHRP